MYNVQCPAILADSGKERLTPIFNCQQAVALDGDQPDDGLGEVLQPHIHPLLCTQGSFSFSLYLIWA